MNVKIAEKKKGNTNEQIESKLKELVTLFGYNPDDIKSMEFDISTIVKTHETFNSIEADITGQLLTLKVKIGG